MTAIHEIGQLSAVLIGLRAAAGLTQTQVATRLGVSRARIYKIEQRPERVALQHVLAYLRAVDGELVLTTRHPAAPAVQTDAPPAGADW